MQRDNHCLYCVFGHNIKMTGVVKVAPFWMEVNISSGPKGDHINSVSEFESRGIKNACVVMEYDP